MTDFLIGGLIGWGFALATMMMVWGLCISAGRNE